MKRYYFDENENYTLIYSTYWYGLINIDKEISTNDDNMFYIKDIFKTKYNIELQWLGIDKNQIRLTIHRNMKYYYYQFEKDILNIIKDIQKKCEFKVEIAIFEAWESKHDSDHYKYTIKRVNQVLKLSKKKLNIEKWNSKIEYDKVLKLEQGIQKIELDKQCTTIVGNIYLEENNINSNHIQELNEYIKEKHKLTLQIIKGINTIHLFINEDFMMNCEIFEEFIFDIFKYIESHYCVLKCGYFKFIHDIGYKYIINKKDNCFHFDKMRCSCIVCPYPTIWKGYLKIKKKKKNWISNEKIKKIDEILREKHDIMFYLYYDENNIYFSICTDSYYYHNQFEHDILKIIHTIEDTLKVQFNSGHFEAWECRFNANFYNYDFSLENKKLKFEKTCINMNQFDTHKKQRIK